MQNRGKPAAFEPAPGREPAPSNAVVTGEAVEANGVRSYTVRVNGRNYQVEVAPGGAVTHLQPLGTSAAGVILSMGAESVKAPMAGHILRINVREGQLVDAGQVVVVMEAMKMETEVRVRGGGVVREVCVKVGDTVGANDILINLG